MRKKKDIIPWINKLDDITNYEGFIYVITYIPTSQQYIGKKSYWSRRRVKVKGRKNRKFILSESNWLYYYSSNKWIKDTIKRDGISNFRFEILKHCKTKREHTYYEVWYQFKENVLHEKLESGEYKFLNDNIQGKFFRTHLN